MIQCSNLVYSIRKTKILKNISFFWECSGLYSIIGPNGAGKTTLLGSLGGFSPLSHGDVFWHGKSVTSIPLKERSKIAAYLPQNLVATEGITVWELMNFSRFPHMGFFRSLNKKEVEFGKNLLGQFHLLNLKNRYLDTLSGGELQRVHLVCCLFQEPKILFLDEPLANLDIHFQREVCVSLKRWCEIHKAQVVMVSHNINLALIWSNEILFLNKGELCFVGKPKDLALSGLVEEIYQKSLETVQKEGKTLFLPRVK